MDPGEAEVIGRLRRSPPAAAPGVDVYKLKEGSRPPVIAVHGGGGVLCFANLSRHMAGDYPFYVVQGKGLDRSDGKPGFSDVYELANAYVDAIADVAAGRPLFVCGRWAPIVLETGRTLVKRGYAVAALIIFDARPWAAERPSSANPEPPGLLRRTLRLARRVPGATTVLELRALVRRAWKRYSPDMRRRGRSQPWKATNWQLASGYVSRSFPGKVVLIRSEAFEGRKGKSNHVPLWRSLSQELDVHVTTGGHASMWRSPHIEPLAALFQEVLDSAAAARDRTARPAPETPPVGARSSKPQ